jgi:N-terminal acetyltransferase B complex non-catalytic subunit
LQFDTLGYLISDHALNFLASTECESFCNESSALYSSNNRDTWALICQSLENQSFVSALDFCEFYNRLERSIQHICTETNYVKLNILKLPLNDLIKSFSSERMTKSLRILSYASEQYIDNRDFKIFDTIDVTGKLKNNIKNLSVFTVIIAIFT